MRTREITASSPSQHKGEGIAVAYEQIAPNNQIRRRRRGGRKNMSNAAYIPYNTNFLNGFVHLVIQTKKKEEEKEEKRKGKRKAKKKALNERLK